MVNTYDMRGRLGVIADAIDYARSYAREGNEADLARSLRQACSEIHHALLILEPDPQPEPENA